jgi:EAL domain-containing protein (putative c-di-GMP-specific phosphodiesterase class I)
VGKDCCVVFEPEMQSAAVDRLALKSNLYSALANDQFFLVFQPIFDLDSMAVRGVEALLRWQHPTRGIIGPDEFIPVLEENGLILGVGRWVLRQACAQAARWADAGRATSMSVNVSMRQLASADLVADVSAALAESHLDPGTLTLEVTESVLMRDADATVAHLKRLKEIGVKIAIDDFGSGQSSLTYLRRFPIDELKIDRSFIAAIDGSRESVALLHTLVALGQNLGLTIVAEGIETCAQLDGLRAEHCGYGQGFIFARPQAPSAIEPFLSWGAVAPGAPAAVRSTRAGHDRSAGDLSRSAGPGANRAGLPLPSADSDVDAATKGDAGAETADQLHGAHLSDA